MSLYRYSRWDGSQDFGFVDEEALLGQMSDELLTHGDVTSALRNLMRRGLHPQGTPKGSPPGPQEEDANGAGEGDQSDTKGLQQLLEQLRQRRQDALGRYDLSSIMDDVKRHLQNIRQQESKGIEREDERGQTLREQLDQSGDPGLDRETAGKLLEDLDRRNAARRAAMEATPWDHPGKAVEHLRGYEFSDAEAKQEFDELMQTLQRQAAESLLKDLSASVGNPKDKPLERVKEMLQDLNHMLENKQRGETPRFDEFMQHHGAQFGGETPGTFEDLIDQMQRRMAQTESLFRSLTNQQRQQLQELMDSALGDEDLERLIRQLAARMEALDPSGSLRREYAFTGEDEVDVTGALELMEQMQQMDRVEQQLRRAHQGGPLDGIDPDSLENVLGEAARRDFERLARMADLLESSGYIQRAGNHFELTPKGMRKIGQRALQEIFAFIKKDRAGAHLTGSAGQGVELADDTKTYEFGDPFLPHLQRTIMNAVKRGSGVPVQMVAEDFEVYRTEHLAQSSTVLMLDLSLSMAMRGNFMAAKKVALALDNLIRTRFPRDRLFIVGFSTYARLMQPDKLAYLRWDEFEPYTNIQHGLVLSQKLLGKVKGGSKQIIMISDGEPTAHIEGGQIFLQYPPSPRTIRQTLAEVRRCTQNRITINTFMLDRNTYLVDFVEQMTKLNHGRVFYTTPERLGKYILVDYMNARKERVAI